MLVAVVLLICNWRQIAFFSFSESNYLRTTYFPVFTFRGCLYFDLFIFLICLFAFSAHALPLQHSCISFACRLQERGFVKLHEIDFLVKSFANRPDCVAFVYCCNLSVGVAWMCDSPRTGCARRTTPIYTWREQAITEWSRRMISIVVCCHSVKLCALATRAFRSQQL